MNSEYNTLILILTGGLLGYGTNWLAIKMLFAPVAKKFLFGYPLPFTPGLIPRERYRIAHSIGTTVATHLITEDEIHKKIKELQIGSTIADITIAEINKRLFLEEGEEKDASLKDVFFKNLLHSVRTSSSVKNKLTATFHPLIAKKAEKEIEKQSPKLIESLNIEQLVIEKINGLDINELEALILSTVSKELRYIALLGGVVGMLIGTVQALFLL